MDTFEQQRMIDHVVARLTPSTVGTMSDDDRHWLAGTIYFNREDRRLLVPKKLGLGYGRTLNLGRPVAWLIVAIPIVIAILAALSRTR